MQYEDRLTVSTPEGVAVEITLAGLGSRMLARALDLALSGVIGIGVSLLIGFALGGFGAPAELAIATGFGFFFFVLLGYDIYFEAFRQGQTPGKRRLSLRVLDEDGGPVTVRTSLARNALRLVDEFGTSLLAGTIAVARSKRNQRLGDMAAGTLVVEVGADEAASGELTISIAAVRILEAGAESWDTSAIDEGDLDAARHLLGRRRSLPTADRRRLAGLLAARIRPRVFGASSDIGDERLLEVVVALKARRGR